MLVYVDLENPILERIDRPLWQAGRAALLRKKYRFEALTGQPCLIIRYDKVTPKRLREIGATAVFVSGCSVEIQHYEPADLVGLRDVFRRSEWPLLAFCGGMQLIAETYGAPIGPIASLTVPDAERPRLSYEATAGVVQEVGFRTLRKRNEHRLLHGLGSEFTIFQAHYWEVKALPDGFELLASSDICAIQAIAHRERPLYGVQCHPENYDDAHPDGRRIISNFLEMAGVIMAPRPE